MIINIIWWFIVLSLLHSVYEWVIAPLMRRLVEYRLFRLRDELRMLAIREDKKIDKAVFEFLQGAINTSLQYSDKLSIALIYKITKEVDNNNEIKNETQRRVDMITSCEDESIKKIYHKQLKSFGHLLVINCGMLFAYSFFISIPIVLVKGISKRILEAFDDILFAPPLTVQRVLAK